MTSGYCSITHDGTGTTTNGTWTTWTNVGTSTNEVWTEWSTSSDSTTMNDSTWTVWIDGQRVYHGASDHDPRPETEAEKRERLEWERKYKAERDEREKKRLRAQRRALLLFAGIVGRDAFANFRKRGYHEVFGHSGKRYRLVPGREIREMDGNFGDKYSATLCVHSGHEYLLPEMDILIQQLLLILSGEKGESLLVKMANRHLVAA